MSSPDLGAAEIAAVQQVLATHHLSLGPRLDAFERALAEYVGAAYGVGVNAGTSGLHLCVIAAGVGPGDLVITTPFSFVASANCILYERAIPVFVDVDPASGNIDPEIAAAAADDLMSGRSAARRWLPPALRDSAPIATALKAVLPVHVFGQPADMDPIVAMARRHNLAVIEDACEAIGAEYKGSRVGGSADAAVFAFYPNKQMTTGEGGIIVTHSEARVGLLRSLRNQGRDVFDGGLAHVRLGYNYRLDEMSAALGLAQLQRLDQMLAQRARVAGWYDERLADLEPIERPTVVESTTRMSWFVYVVRIKAPYRREEVVRRLAAAGIPSRPYFTPIHLQPFYRQQFGYRRSAFPVAEYLGDVSLALPFSSVMAESQVDRVCDVLRSILGDNAC